MMQKKLTDTKKEDCHKIATLLGGAFNWDDTPEGYEYWKGIANKLRDIAKHGTSDGKPWVEPEPEIPPGWRKADPDEWRRTDVKFWYVAEKEWRNRFFQGVAFDKPPFKTHYIVPIDPPLTDRDACVWPRPLVMARDFESDSWEGPYKYMGKLDSDEFPFLTDRVGVASQWRFARRATTDEIEAAK